MPALNDAVTIVGAGPSGLACAITLARAGVPATVREARSTVGARFHGDFQGLENWSSETDVLDELATFGIASRFEHTPVSTGIAFDDRGRAYEIRGACPLFYLVRRGSGEGTLDRSLCAQALESGVQIHFGDKVESLDPRGEGAIAAGPRLPYAIAAGYVFDTTMRDAYYIRFDERLAPAGYCYLLVHGGRGTLATCMFRNFRDEQGYVERTRATFERDVGLIMNNARPFGGSGSFFLRRSAFQGRHLVAGEYAGLQDALFGFGMRWAMRSGVWAARALLGLEDANTRWQRDVRRRLRAGLSNRLIFDRLGNVGRRWLLRRLARSKDPRAFLRHAYEGNALSLLLAPLAAVSDRVRLRDPSCAHRNCSCVWCRESAETSC